MKPGSARAKGSTFERLLAADIVKATGCKKRECYRTPLSGGHPFACPSDLQLSPRLQERFPFSVEAKHQKIFKLEMMFRPPKSITNWLQQCMDASCSANQIGNKISPLVVMRGNRTLTYAAGYSEAIAKFMGWSENEGIDYAPRLTFYYFKKSGARKRWTLIPWSMLVRRLHEVANFHKVLGSKRMRKLLK